MSARCVGRGGCFQEVWLRGRRLFIKRDDLLRLGGVNGNKARKLQHFSSLRPFPRRVFSIGGVQSNSMLAVATIVAQHEKSSFHYVIKHLPKFLRDNPSGNFLSAVKMGMQVVEVDTESYNQLMAVNCCNLPPAYPSLINRDFLACDYPIYWIPQGGAMMDAKEGIDVLGFEICRFLRESTCLTDSNGQGGSRKCEIYVESGTGTTAYHLHQFFRQCPPKELSQFLNNSYETWEVTVTAVSCVMPPSNLLQNMKHYFKAHTFDGEDSKGKYPKILRHGKCCSGISEEKFRPFGTPHLELLSTWRYLQSETGIPFDLLYAPRAFEQIFKWWDSVDKTNALSGDKDAVLLYIHCGGVEGNVSQLNRYKHLKLL